VSPFFILKNHVTARNNYLLLKKKAMSDNFFESSTAAVGTIYTIVVLAILTCIMIWG
jgi:hypothetical protein